HHPVDRRADAEELALHLLSFDLQLDLLRQVALGDRLDHARYLGRRLYEIRNETIHSVDRSHPLPADAGQLHAVAHLALAPDRRAHPADLLGEPRLLLHDAVEHVDDVRHERIAVRRQLHREVARVHRAQPGEQPVERSLARRTPIGCRSVRHVDVGRCRVRSGASVLARAFLAASRAVASADAAGVVRLACRVYFTLEYVRTIANAHGQLLMHEGESMPTATEVEAVVNGSSSERFCSSYFKSDAGLG